MMRHFKFVGGPWDGEYHEVDSETCKRGYLDVAKPPFEPIRAIGVAEVVIDQTFEYTTYTLRHFAGPDGDVYFFCRFRVA